MAKADMYQHGAGNRNGPMIIRQWVGGVEIDCVALKYPYKSTADFIPLGTKLLFFSPGGGHTKRTHDKGTATPPPGLFPTAPAGFIYNFQTEKMDKLVCQPGSFASTDAAGMASCELCMPGQFTETGKEMSCSNCNVGTYSQSAGSSACAMCDAGNWSDLMRGAECKPCILGRFSPRSVKPTGTFAKQTGSSACMKCETGSYADTTKASECTFVLQASQRSTRAKSH